MRMAKVEIRVPTTNAITLSTDWIQGMTTIVVDDQKPSGKISALEPMTMMNSTAPDCDTYWDHAHWLPPWYILDRWCQQDDRCRHAKYEALLTACERGDIKYDRRDGKDFNDPVRELANKRILIIERSSFDTWATAIDGQSPLAAPPRPARPLLPTPAWAYVQQSQKPTTTPLAADNRHTRDDAPEQGAVDDDDGPAPNTSACPNLNPPAGDVPTAEIIAAFPVCADETENTKWWKDRMSEAKDYGLTDARTYAGRLRDPSRWRPDGIALWLVSKGHLPAKTVKRIIIRDFPDWAEIVDYFIDD
jgi:hypothetical protein